MKAKISILFLLLTVMLSSCGIFKPSCHCPHVSYQAYSKYNTIRNS